MRDEQEGDGRRDAETAENLAPSTVSADAPGPSRPPPAARERGESDRGAIWPWVKRDASQFLSSNGLQRFREKALSLDASKPDILEEGAAALKLAQKIRSREIDIVDIEGRLEFIFQCLTASEPLLILARDARLQLQIDVYKRSGIVSRVLAGISDGSSVGLVLAALIVSLILWTGLAWCVDWLVHQSGSSLAGDIFFMDGRALIVIASAAFVGGVVSIATRLKEFSRVRDLDPFAMFWTAMLKPLIGVILSFFILATLAGGVVSFSILPIPKLLEEGDAPEVLKALYVLWMIGFLAGFSERFAWDFVNRAQGVTATPKERELSGGL